MTITGTAVKFPYTGNGVTTIFPFTGRLQNASEMTVYIAGVLQVGGYVVSFGTIPPYNGSVTITPAPANGLAVLLVRSTPRTQATDWVENDPDPASSKEDAVDKLTNVAQEQDEAISRAPKYGVATTLTPLIDTPVGAGDVGKFAQLKDVNGNIGFATPVTSGGLSNPVSIGQGGTGVAAASLAALAKAIGLALWGGSNGGSATLTVTANIGQLPDPLTTNIFTVASAIQGLTTIGAIVGQCIKLYWNAGAVVATHTGSFFLMGRQNHTFTTGDMSEFTYVGGGTWIETDRYINALVIHPSQFWRGDGSWVSVPNAIGGMQLSNNAGDATNDIDISAGARFSDDADFSQRLHMNLAALITKRIDANWAVGTNQGGLDTGVVANGVYHMWAIMRVDVFPFVVDALFSLSATAPTMPANYTKKWRIGPVLREAGVLVPFVQKRAYFRRKASPAAYDSGANPGAAAITATLPGMPTGISIDALFNWQIDSGGSNVIVLWSDLAANDEAPVQGASPLGQGYVELSAGAIVRTMGDIRIRMNTSAQVRLRLSASAAGTRVFANPYGWVDEESQG